MNEKAEQKNQEAKGRLKIDVSLRSANVPLRHHSSSLMLTEDQIDALDEMEQWQFLSVQIWTHDVCNFIISIFEILVFVLALFSMNWTAFSNQFILNFAFEC